MHIKKYSTIPLDTFHTNNEISNMHIASTVLHNMGAHPGSQKREPLKGITQGEPP